MVSRRKALQLIGSAGLVSTAGCAGINLNSKSTPSPNEDPPEDASTDWTPPVGTWPLPGADTQNTRRSEIAVPGSPSIAWQAQPRSGSGQKRSITIVGATSETVYTAGPLYTDGEGAVRAWSSTDGTLRWKTPINHLTDIGGVVNRTVYASEQGKVVHALDAATGHSKWHINAYDRLSNVVPTQYLTAPSGLRPQLLPTPETVYMTTSYGLHGLDPGSGTERWRIYVPQGSDPSVPLGGAASTDVAIGSYGYGSVQLASVANTEVQTADASWADTAWYDHVSDPLIFDGQLYITLRGHNSPGSLPAIAAGYRTLSQLDQPSWKFPAPDDSDGPTQVQSPTTDGERIFLVQLAPVGNQFRATTIAVEKDGTQKWTHTTPITGSSTTELKSYAIGAPVVAGNVVLVGITNSITDGKPNRSGGQVLALDTKTGDKRWQVSLQVTPTELAVTSGRVYVAGLHGDLIALSLSGHT